MSAIGYTYRVESPPTWIIKENENVDDQRMDQEKNVEKNASNVGGWLAGWHGGERKVRRNRGNNFSNKSLFMNNSIFVLAEVRRCVYARQVFCVLCTRTRARECEHGRELFWNSFFPFACAAHSRTFQFWRYSHSDTHTHTVTLTATVSQSFENNSRYKYLMKNIRKVVKSLRVPHWRWRWRRRRRETIWPKLATSFASTKQYVRSPLCSYHVRALRRFHTILKRRRKK